MSSRDLFAFEWLTHLKWVGRKYQILLPNIKSNRLTFNIQQLYKRNVQIFQTCMSKHWKSKNSALQENEWTWGKILGLAFFTLRYMLALSWRKVWGWFQELGSHYFVRAMFRSQRWLYCPFLLVCFRILLLQCLDFQQWVPYYRNKNGTDCRIVVNWLQPKSHCCHICPQYWSLQKNFSKKDYENVLQGPSRVFWWCRSKQQQARVKLIKSCSPPSRLWSSLPACLPPVKRRMQYW